MIYLCLKRNGEQWVGLGEIAEAIASPPAFTAKILQQLSRSQLLDSVRGRHGGFRIPPDRTITMAAIVEAIDGNHIMTGCVLGFSSCSESHPCPVHHKFKSVRDYLTGTLMSTSLEEISEGMKDAHRFLKP